ncbi:MAG: hypothetical protein AAFN48_12360 [Pseudomonadota bacterium]
MTLDISMRDGGKLVFSRLSGRLTDKDLFEAQDQFERRVAWTEGASELIDLSDADLSDVSMKVMPELAERFRAYFEDAGIAHARVAICGPSDLQFGTGRVFEVWASRNDVPTVAIFRDREAANRWLS